MKLSELLFSETWQPKPEVVYLYAKNGSAVTTKSIDEVMNYFIMNEEYSSITAEVARFVKDDLVKVIYQWGLQNKAKKIEIVFAWNTARGSFVIGGNYSFENSNKKEESVIFSSFNILRASFEGKEFVYEIQKKISEVTQEEIRFLVEEELRVEEETPTEEAKENFLLRMQKHFKEWFKKNLKNTGVVVPAGGVARSFSKNDFEIGFVSDVDVNPMVITVNYKEINKEKPKQLAFKYYTDTDREIKFVLEVESEDSYYPQAELEVFYPLKKSIDPLSLKYYGGLQGAGEIVDNSIRAGLNKLKKLLQKV